MDNFEPVAIDIREICRHLSLSSGRPVSDVEAALWLRGEGFVHFGNTWVGDGQSLRSLENLQQRLATQPAQ
jgi:hypothetical protein